MSLQLEVTRLALQPQAGGHTLVHRLSLGVPSGVIHTVMGPSGSGKSSLLAAVSGTLASAMVFEGRVLLNGRDLTALPTEARQVGILFQDDLLFPHMTVRENLLFAVPPGRRALRESRVAQALTDLEMPDFAHADPATLSGGQRSRVALMRALLAEPDALLLDEPFAKLDSALRARMRTFVYARLRQAGIPTLLVTHDAQDVADPEALTLLGQA
jgi:putative thiamine transport system ATP-binding protein